MNASTATPWNFDGFSYVTVGLDLKFDDCGALVVLLRMAREQGTKLLQFVVLDVKNVLHAGALIQKYAEESGIDQSAYRICCERSPKELNTVESLPHEFGDGVVDVGMFNCVEGHSFKWTDFKPVIPATKEWASIVLAPTQKPHNFVHGGETYMALGHNFTSSGMDESTFVGKRLLTANNFGSADGPELGRFTVCQLDGIFALSPLLKSQVISALQNSCYFAVKQLSKKEVKLGLAHPWEENHDSMTDLYIEETIKLESCIFDMGLDDKDSADPRLKPSPDLSSYKARCLAVYEAMKKNGEIEQVPEVVEVDGQYELKNGTGQYIDRVFEQFCTQMQIECTDLWNVLAWFGLKGSRSPVFLAPEPAKYRFTSFYIASWETTNSAIIGVSRKRIRDTLDEFVHAHSKIKTDSGCTTI